MRVTQMVLIEREDEVMMKEGRPLTMQIGNMEVLVSMESRRRKNSDVHVIGPVSKDREGVTSQWPCRYCPKICGSAPGRGSHEKMCKTLNTKKRLTHDTKM